MAKLNAEQLLATIKIPPRPAVLVKVIDEQRQEYPDMGKIAGFIATDVSLSAAVLKTVNSPFFGLSRRVSSINETVNLLGSKHIASLVTGLAARNAIPSPGIETFWDEATLTALIASHIAPRHGQVDRETAHMFGLFHDCGIPLLMTRFKDYPETMQLAANAADATFTQIEDQRHNTNHAVVGGLLATNWQLPDSIRQAIRLHHEPGIFTSNTDLAVLKLIAIGHLAEHLVSQTGRCTVDSDWHHFDHIALDLLNIQQDDLEELQRDTQEILQNHG